MGVLDPEIQTLASALLRRALVVLLLASSLLGKAQGEILARCELAVHLQEGGLGGFKGYSLADWICLAYQESKFDTMLISTNSDGSTDYGLFQINSHIWCADHLSHSQNRCKVSCIEILNNIVAHILCAKKIVSEHSGLKYWSSWTEHCEGRDLSHWVAGCDL
ncbi:lysozyme-like protein 6 [Tachyglossus aculeatus]|uniref:lysozyme-like protein 6 n=1 Tax=Tachyglossus aculeatus TaxID=9261 RepID=UPI0018F64ED5|nr:lysozyme-like protein 6 [Tachyglossus aculeatus]